MYIFEIKTLISSCQTVPSLRCPCMCLKCKTVNKIWELWQNERFLSNNDFNLVQKLYKILYGHFMLLFSLYLSMAALGHCLFSLNKKEQPPFVVLFSEEMLVNKKTNVYYILYYINMYYYYVLWIIYSMIIHVSSCLVHKITLTVTTFGFKKNH